MKKKNLLAENMLRFKAKNLSETAKQNIVALARIIKEAEATSDPGAPSKLSAAYSPGDIISRPFGNQGTSLMNLQYKGVTLVSADVKRTMPIGQPYPAGAYYIDIKLSFTDKDKKLGDVIIPFIKKPGEKATITGNNAVQMSGQALTGDQASNLKGVIRNIATRNSAALYTSNFPDQRSIDFWPKMYEAMDNL